MLPLPSVFSPSALTAGMLNALLRRETWAAERLGRHAGKSLRFNAGRLQLNYTIQMGGLVRACDPAVLPDVSLSIAPEHLADLPGTLRSGDLNAITERLHVQGDAALATLVSELARDLRWDLEDSLSSRLGDLLGPALVKGGRQAAGFVRVAGERAVGNVAEYLGEEGNMLVTRPAVLVFSARLEGLRAKLDSLEQRLGRLERTRS